MGGILLIHYVLSDFDVLEITKLDQLAQAREGCDRLVAGLVSDKDVKAVTGRDPFNGLGDRLDLVSHLRIVDQVFPHIAGQSTQFLGPNVRYFVTDESFQELLTTPSTVIQPTIVSQSNYLTALRNSSLQLAVS